MNNEKEINGFFETDIRMILSFSMKYELPFSLEEVQKNREVKVEIDKDDGELIIEYPDGTMTHHYPTIREPFHYWNEEWEVEFEDFWSSEEWSNV